jgi:hypothetical protein
MFKWSQIQIRIERPAILTVTSMITLSALTEMPEQYLKLDLDLFFPHNFHFINHYLSCNAIGITVKPQRINKKKTATFLHNMHNMKIFNISFALVFMNLVVCLVPGTNFPFSFLPYFQVFTCISTIFTATFLVTARWQSLIWGAHKVDSYWQETDPTSPQRGRPTEIRQQISDKIIIWSQVHSGLDTKTYWLTDWLTVSHNVASASATLVD